MLTGACSPTARRRGQLRAVCFALAEPLGHRPLEARVRRRAGYSPSARSRSMRRLGDKVRLARFKPANLAETAPRPRLRRRAGAGAGDSAARRAAADGRAQAGLALRARRRRIRLARHRAREARPSSRLSSPSPRRRRPAIGSAAAAVSAVRIALEDGDIVAGGRVSREGQAGRAPTRRIAPRRGCSKAMLARAEGSALRRALRRGPAPAPAHRSPHSGHRALHPAEPVNSRTTTAKRFAKRAQWRAPNTRPIRFRRVPRHANSVRMSAAEWRRDVLADANR